MLCGKSEASVSRFRGREVDDIALWENYIEIPHGSEKETHYWMKAVCPNPEHDTTKRHFQVNVQDGLVHCFAHCGISGTYLHAIQTVEGCNDREAKRIILGYAGGKRKRPVSNSSRPATDTVPTESLEYERYILPVGMEYLESRGITSTSIARFEIGWCPDTLRVVIPAKDI